MTWVFTNPDFTQCFKWTALIWTPCAFLLIFSLSDIYMRSKSRYSDIPFGFLNVAKGLVLLALICLTIVDLTMLIRLRLDEDEIDIYDVQIVSASVKALTFVSSQKYSRST